ncbi:MAG: formylglycine-generating enzyme family protein [Alphaproteobacteria bacterium]
MIKTGRSIVALGVFLTMVIVVPLLAWAGNDDKDRAPGTTFRDCQECPEMVVVPAGQFIMGSQDGDDDEKPPHQVTLSRPFAVGRSEVTVGQWAAFVNASGHTVDNSCYHWSASKWVSREGRTWRRPGFDQSEHDPVVCVSWEDASAFVKWLNRKVSGNSNGSGPYRLLTEAEWEYASRAGGTGEWSCGSDKNCLNEVAWYNANSGSKTHPAASKAANAFGLHDMHGNVWEWVEDCFVGSHAGAPVDGAARKCDGSPLRVVRGGSWDGNFFDLRSSSRIGIVAEDRFFSTGFRIARSIP